MNPLRKVKFLISAVILLVETLCLHSQSNLDNYQGREQITDQIKEIRDSLPYYYAEDKFYNMISHELKTPLHTIIEIAELIDDGKEGNLAIPLRYSSNHWLTLINNIVQSIKNDDNNLEEDDNIFRIDLRRLIFTVKEALEVAIQNNSNEFKVTIQDDVPNYFISNKFKLKHILLNLIGNAAKFTKNGSIELVVSKGAELGDDSYA